MIGQELGGRYEIIDRIGGGGMALVYKAHDILLHRKVAIKVLRQQYVHDEEFIRRFRREAQSAASLSHPNVVSIYDVGQQGEIHYIVMEYIEGTNLNEKIKEKAPLQVEEAIHIASQICDALEHAHNNQIIHRDIKPHNILLGKNGRVKVTDFGIARAATSSHITQTGSVLGSVHYFSPEHAKGISQGEKSDLYSLGIVLYQMLTGKLPFLGESPISVALKHLQEDVEDPRKINPLIPQSVENIILKALRKKPEERYQSAKQMLTDLESSLLPERKNETKKVFIDGGDEFEDEQRTRVMPAIRPDQHQAAAPAEQDPWAGLEEKKASPWLKPLIWLILTIALLVAMWYGVAYLKGLFKVPEVEVPTVIGLPIEEAVAVLKAANLTADPIDYIYSNDIDKDFVIDQQKSGMRVKTNSTVGLTVSKGVQTVAIQDLIGMQWKDAELELKASFPAGKVVKEEIFSEEPPGTVVDQSPKPNEEIDPRDANIKITVSQGTGTIAMPNLIGLKESVVKSIITRSNLKLPDVNILYYPSYTPKGYVFKQFPYQPNDPVEPGSEITIHVSTGNPADALEYVKNVEVSPTKPGQKTTIKITINDARDDVREWGVREITETMTYPVSVVLSKEKNAVITIYRNNSFYDTLTITYQDAEKQQGGPETTEPQSEDAE
jgi:beta-lactam-binding protein with PASTA domain/tRNA A-37 threonylcarbamoyl transferase component Bud32